MEKTYHAILKRKGSAVTCPICKKACEGGRGYLETGVLAKGQTKGCKHYDGWGWDMHKKIMSHYFVK
jgi:hypothetical protein